MITKFLDFDKIYNFCFNEKIVTPKNLPLQAFVIATLENSFGRSTLKVRETMKVPKQISNNKSRNLGIFDILLEVSILNLTYDFCGYF